MGWLCKPGFAPACAGFGAGAYIGVAITTYFVAIVVALLTHPERTKSTVAILAEVLPGWADTQAFDLDHDLVMEFRIRRHARIRTPVLSNCQVDIGSKEMSFRSENGRFFMRQTITCNVNSSVQDTQGHNRHK